LVLAVGHLLKTTSVSFLWEGYNICYELSSSINTQIQNMKHS